MLRTLQPDWSDLLLLATLLQVHCNNYTGFRCNTASPINCLPIHTSQSSSNLTDIVTQTASVTSRTQLRSGSSLHYEQPCTRLKFGQRAFSYAARSAWNSLPPSLQELSDTASFKQNLKTLLFQRAFYLWVVFLLF